MFRGESNHPLLQMSLLFWPSDFGGGVTPAGMPGSDSPRVLLCMESGTPPRDTAWATSQEKVDDGLTASRTR